MGLVFGGIATATCPNCGTRAFGLNIQPCYICRRPICQRCTLTFGYQEEVVLTPPVAGNLMGMSFPGGGGTLSAQPSQYFGVCSWACFDGWATMVFRQGQAPAMNGYKYMLGGIVLVPATATRASQLYQAFRTSTGLERAQKMLEAEDFEGAAREYETLGMWEKAAEARRRDHTVTEVQVNVNQLVEQLRASGVSTNYTCPTCGSRIPITGDTNLAALATCAYCGSVIRMTDLVDFLTKVVGRS